MANHAGREGADRSTLLAAVARHFDKLEAAGVRINMDGRGRWLDTVFVEPLWRSLKYEEVHFESLSQCSRGAQWHQPMVPLLQREPTAPGFDLQNSRRRCGRPRCALWICRCAWTTLAPRPQLHGSNNSITCCTSDEEEERTSPYQRTPVVLRLGPTAGCSRGEPPACCRGRRRAYLGTHSKRRETRVFDKVN